MKKRITKPVCVLTAVMMLGSISCACSSTDETTVSSESTSVSTSVSASETETSVTETTEYVLETYPGFVSSNGELEGQDEYMILRTEDTWTSPTQITDLNDIEDEELRNAAQMYADEGHAIYDALSWHRYGDIEYEFSVGFECEWIEDGMLKKISVWKMNETLFEFFIFGNTGYGVWWNDDEGGLEDDGTCISRYLDIEYDGDHFYACFEYDRDTGLMTFYSEGTNSDYWEIHVVSPDLIADENIRDIAQGCVDNGYSISELGNDIWESYTWEGEEYQLKDGFDATCTMGDEFRNVSVLVMDEDCFNATVVGRFSIDRDELELVDDGTLVRYLDLESGYIYEFDRDTGLTVIYEDSAYTANPDRASLIEGLDAIHGF